MRWVVNGTSKSDGRATTIEVEADSEVRAIVQAEQCGVRGESATQAPSVDAITDIVNRAIATDRDRASRARRFAQSKQATAGLSLVGFVLLFVTSARISAHGQANTGDMLLSLGLIALGVLLNLAVRVFYPR